MILILIKYRIYSSHRFTSYFFPHASSNFMKLFFKTIPLLTDSTFTRLFVFTTTTGFLIVSMSYKIFRIFIIFYFFFLLILRLICCSSPYLSIVTQIFQFLVDSFILILPHLGHVFCPRSSFYSVSFNISFNYFLQ